MAWRVSRQHSVEYKCHAMARSNCYIIWYWQTPQPMTSTDSRSTNNQNSNMLSGARLLQHIGDMGLMEFSTKNQMISMRLSTLLYSVICHQQFKSRYVMHKILYSFSAKNVGTIFLKALKHTI